MCFGTSFPAPPEGTFKSLAMGPYHACAIHTDDRLTCWGQNVYGESTPPY
jgi:alpha-tubulin suppressor-like RCC1 family protein